MAEPTQRAAAPAPRVQTPGHEEEEKKKRLRFLLLLLLLLLGVGLVVAGYIIMTRPAPGMKDLYGNPVSLNTPPKGMKVDGKKVGSLDIPAIGLKGGLRYMTSTGSVIDPMDATNFWLDETNSPGWPKYNGRLMISAHSMPIAAGKNAKKVAGAGNLVQGVGPGITRWPRVGDTVVVNKTHQYSITALIHESRKATGIDKRVLDASSLVIVTCYRGPGYADEQDSSENFVILTKPLT